MSCQISPNTTVSMPRASEARTNYTEKSNDFKSQLDKAVDSNRLANKKADTKKSVNSKNEGNKVEDTNPEENITDVKNSENDKSDIKQETGVENKPDSEGDESTDKTVNKQPVQGDISMLAALLNGTLVTRNEQGKEVQLAVNIIPKEAIAEETPAASPIVSVEQKSAVGQEAGISNLAAATQQQKQVKTDVNVLQSSQGTVVKTEAEPLNEKKAETVLTAAADSKIAEQKPVTVSEQKGGAQQQQMQQKQTDTLPKNIRFETATDDTKIAEENMSAVQTLQMPKAGTEELLHFKVGDVINTESETFTKDMAENIMVKAGEGKNEFEIELTPKDLGKILVKIAFEGGQTSVSLICSNPKTLSLLAENARGISAVIESNTGGQATVNVQNEKESAYEQQRSDENGRGQRNGQQESEHSRKQQQTFSTDFIQQMRLGLVGEQNWDTNYRYNVL